MPSETKTSKQIMIEIFERFVDRPGPAMLASEVIKKLEDAGYDIVKITKRDPLPFQFDPEDAQRS